MFNNVECVASVCAVRDVGPCAWSCVSRVRHGCVTRASRKCHACVTEVSRVCHGRTSEVLKLTNTPFEHNQRTIVQKAQMNQENMFYVLIFNFCQFRITYSCFIRIRGFRNHTQRFGPPMLVS